MATKDDLAQVVLFQLDQTSRKAKQYSQKAFDEKGLDITIDQWVLLKIIEAGDRLSQRELAKNALRDPAAITRTLDVLERKELVERVSIAGNRRKYEIQLSAKGEAFVQDNMELVRNHRRQSLMGFTVQEIKTLKSMLSRVYRNMS